MIMMRGVSVLSSTILTALLLFIHFVCLYFNSHAAHAPSQLYQESAF